MKVRLMHLWALLSHSSWCFSIFQYINEAALKTEPAGKLTLIGHPDQDFRMTPTELEEWKQDLNMFEPAKVYLYLNNLVVNAVEPKAAAHNREIMLRAFEDTNYHANLWTWYNAHDWKSLLENFRKQFGFTTLKATYEGICSAFGSYVDGRVSENTDDLVYYIQQLFIPVLGERTTQVTYREGVDLILHLCLQRHIIHEQLTLLRSKKTQIVSSVFQVDKNSARITRALIPKKFLPALTKLMVLSFLSPIDEQDLIFLQEMWRPLTLANFGEFRRLITCTRIFGGFTVNTRGLHTQTEVDSYYQSSAVKSSLIPCVSMYSRALAGTVKLQLANAEEAMTRQKEFRAYEGAADTVYPVGRDMLPMVLDNPNYDLNIAYDVVIGKWISRMFQQAFLSRSTHAKAVLKIVKHSTWQLVWLCEDIRWRGYNVDPSALTVCSAARRYLISPPPALTRITEDLASQRRAKRMRAKLDPRPTFVSLMEDQKHFMTTLTAKSTSQKFEKLLPSTALGIAHYAILKFTEETIYSTEFAFPTGSAHHECAKARRHLRSNMLLLTTENLLLAIHRLESLSLHLLIYCAFDHYAIHKSFGQSLKIALADSLYARPRDCNL